MKYLFLIIGLWLMFDTSIQAQDVPKEFAYQAVLRDAQNNPMSGREIAVRVEILQGGPGSDVVYLEDHSTTTTNLGLFTLKVGRGTPMFGDFPSINWGLGNFWLRISIDETGGTNFTEYGTSEILAVAYANYAARAENVDDDDADPVNEIQLLSRTGNLVALSKGGGTVNINDDDADSTNEIQTLAISGNELSISDGNSVLLPADVDDMDRDSSNEIQNLSAIKVGPNIELGISKGNSVVLNVDDADANPVNELQLLSYQIVDDTLYLAIENGNMLSIPLPSGGSGGPDSSQTDELQELLISQNGTQIQLSLNPAKGTAVVFNVDDADNDPVNEIQNLNLQQSGPNVMLSIQGGNQVAFVVNDADADPTNEIQTLELAGNQLSITGGNTVELPSGTGQWTPEPDMDIFYKKGRVGIGLENPNQLLSVGGGDTETTVSIANTFNGDAALGLDVQSNHGMGGRFVAGKTGLRAVATGQGATGLLTGIRAYSESSLVDGSTNIAVDASARNGATLFGMRSLAMGVDTSISKLGYGLASKAEGSLFNIGVLSEAGGGMNAIGLHARTLGNPAPGGEHCGLIASAVNTIGISIGAKAVGNTAGIWAGTNASGETIDIPYDPDPNPSSAGIVGIVDGTNPAAIKKMAVAGVTNSSGVSTNFGLFGVAVEGSVNAGVFGYANGPNSGSGQLTAGVIGQSGPSGASLNYAGFFLGDVYVDGTLSKAGGSFKIDHPLYPESKYLVHSFVESPDMMNIYNGNIVTDENGIARVALPEYFEALNMEFRYQLTVIGSFAQAVVWEEIEGNEFEIRTSDPNVKVSWQVTGVRKDAWAEKNRLEVEPEKNAHERGLYLHPDAFGLGQEKALTNSLITKPRP